LAMATALEELNAIDAPRVADGGDARGSRHGLGGRRKFGQPRSAEVCGRGRHGGGTPRVWKVWKKKWLRPIRRLRIVAS
jgi:hypothetical protein